MKINRERVLILAEHWASCAMGFGLGYWMLSYLQSGLAHVIAWALVGLGAFAKVAVHSRLKRLYEDAASSGSTPMS